MQKPFQSSIREIWNLYACSINFIPSKSILTIPFVYTIICNPAEKFHSLHSEFNQAGQSLGVRSHWKMFFKGLSKPFKNLSYVLMSIAEEFDPQGANQFWVLHRLFLFASEVPLQRTSLRSCWATYSGWKNANIQSASFPLTQGSPRPSAILFSQVVEWVEPSVGSLGPVRSVRFKVGCEGFGSLRWGVLSDFFTSWV